MYYIARTYVTLSGMLMKSFDFIIDIDEAVEDGIIYVNKRKLDTSRRIVLSKLQENRCNPDTLPQVIKSLQKEMKVCCHKAETEFCLIPVGDCLGNYCKK